MKMKLLLGIILSFSFSTAFAGSADLNWNASPTDPALVTGYKVYRGTTPGGPYTLTQSLGKVTTATELNLSAGAKYCWVVTAYNIAGDSPYSNEACATIPFPVPAGASGLNAVGKP